MCPIRILIVDDSAFMRLTLGRRLAETPGFEVIGKAGDGHEALAMMPTLRPDVVTMDVEMPGLNGLDTLAKIMESQPTPVVMVSSLTREGTDTTVRALTLGAVDFVSKPAQTSQMSQMVVELAEKIRGAATARVQKRISLTRIASEGADKGQKAMLRNVMRSDRVISIGSSTGGPGALRQLLGALPGTLDAAIVIVQHMPPGFTRSLADRLDEESAWVVKEAQDGDRLLCGQALLAPGGHHLEFDKFGVAMLTRNPPVNNVRPAVDVTTNSVVEAFGSRVLGVVLTGMGRDGTRGAEKIKRTGGQVIAEHESTCAVYGMPRSAVEAGVVDHIAPLPQIPALIHRLIGSNGNE